MPNAKFPAGTLLRAELIYIYIYIYNSTPGDSREIRGTMQQARLSGCAVGFERTPAHFNACLADLAGPFVHKSTKLSGQGALG